MVKFIAFFTLAHSVDVQAREGMRNKFQPWKKIFPPPIYDYLLLLITRGGSCFS